MKLFTTDLVVFTLCWTLPQLVSAKDFSESLLNFLAILNGDYDNLEQSQKGFVKHAYIQFRVVPVDIPILQPAITWYDEWAADGKVLHMEIAVITERPRGSIYLTLYNFTDPSRYKPGEFDVSTLADLKPEDLQGTNCTAVFRRLDKAVYVGYWPDCRTVINGNHPNYADTVTCKRASIVVPPTVEERFAPPPYIFRRVGPRYRYSRVPDTYDNLCGPNEE